ncbi:MAG TPA: acetyl-CoA carboxylase biotin carboxyl carrier protein subunit [Gemmatimonadales bacterium]
MKYFVTLAGRTFEVDVDGTRVVVDGSALDAHVAAIPGTPLHHLLLAGASWTVAADPRDLGEWVIAAVGERFQVEVTDERTRQIRARSGPPPRPAGTGVVAAPMPGLVVRVGVREGQRVEAGEGLVVIEAMKMENELRAPRAGIVVRVHVSAGEAVEKGIPLVTLESSEPSR